MNYTPTEHVPRKPPDACASGQAPPPPPTGDGEDRTSRSHLLMVCFVHISKPKSSKHESPHTNNTNPNGSEAGTDGTRIRTKRPWPEGAVGLCAAPSGSSPGTGLCTSSARLLAAPNPEPHSGDPPPPPPQDAPHAWGGPCPPAQPLLQAHHLLSLPGPHPRGPSAKPDIWGLLAPFLTRVCRGQRGGGLVSAECSERLSLLHVTCP